MSTPKLQLVALNVMWGVLLVIFFYKFHKVHQIEHILIGITTLIMLFQIWWGAFFYMKNASYARYPIEALIDLFLLGLLFLSVYSLENIPNWFFIFGTFFILVVVKYVTALMRVSNKKLKKYLKLKIKLEVPCAFLLYFGGIIDVVLFYWWVPIVLSLGAFVAQFIFIYLTFIKIKIYNTSEY